MTAQAKPNNKVDTRHAALAREILQIVRSENWEAGQRITELAMAEKLGVSRSPVRAALQILHRQNLVRHESNRGYFLAVSWHAREIDGRNLGDDPSSQIYQTIMRDRFSARLGDRVSISDLVNRYDMPRAAIKNVLEQMREDGILERGKGHNWLFKHSLADETSFLESCRHCLILEPAALREPGFRADTKRIAALRRQYEQLLHTSESRKPLDDLLDLNAAFHIALADSCGNRFIAQAIRHHAHLRRICEYDAYALGVNLQRVIGEHLHILDTIQADNLELAATLMQQHWHNTLQNRPDIAKARVFAHRRLTRR